MHPFTRGSNLAVPALLILLLATPVELSSADRVGNFKKARERAARAIIDRSAAAIIKSKGKAKARPEQYRGRIKLLAQALRYYSDYSETVPGMGAAGPLGEYARRFPDSVEGKYAARAVQEYNSLATRYRYVVPYYLQFLATKPTADEELAAIGFLKQVEMSTQSATGKAAYLGSRRHMAAKEKAPAETAAELLASARQLLSKGGKRNQRRHAQGVEKARALLLHFPLAPEALEAGSVLRVFQKKFKSRSTEPARRLLREWPPRSYP